MPGPNGKTRYLLVHFTKHDRGRELMKDCMWKVCPDAAGSFYALKDDQQVLLTPTPDLEPLRSWVLGRMGSSGVRWKALHDDLLSETWRGKQLNDVVRELRKEGALEARDYSGNFAPKNDPLLVRKKPRAKKSKRARGQQRAS